MATKQPYLQDTYTSTSDTVLQALALGQTKFEEIIAEHERPDNEFLEVLKSDALTDLNVPRGGCYSLPYLVQKGCSICWQFRVKEHDLAFAVKIRVQGMGGSTEE
eukprot:10378-Heterococcus_DN1.PRE.1